MRAPIHLARVRWKVFDSVLLFLVDINQKVWLEHYFNIMAGHISKKRKASEHENEQEMRELFETISQRSKVKVIESEDHYRIKDFQDKVIDVARCFQELQQIAINKCNTQGLILKSHPHHVLGLSSILLLKPEEYSGDLLVCFTSNQLNCVRFEVLKKLGGDNYEDIGVNMALVMKIMMIMEEVLAVSLIAYFQGRLDNLVKGRCFINPGVGDLSSYLPDHAGNRQIKLQVAVKLGVSALGNYGKVDR
ncbi:hypothetical protein K501DRAFT_338444 [Backusella circina FSU 941]|nr:hypothetical protein K501DRAFT_338444 [Backusella circina FSU 941]